MNTQDYWRRHAIEALVIVGSILLAFAIDAAWESRKDNAREKQLIAFIQTDMERNAIELSRIIELNLEKNRGLSNFMSASPESLLGLSDSASASDFLEVSSPAIRMLYAVTTFTPFKGSLEDSSLSEIDNAQLRNELGAWLGMSDGVTELTTRNLEGSENLRAIAAKHGAVAHESQGIGLLPEVFPEGELTTGKILSELRTDEDFIFSLLQYHNQRYRTGRRLGPLKESTEKLILLLQENK